MISKTKITVDMFKIGKPLWQSQKVIILNKCLLKEQKQKSWKKPEVILLHKTAYIENIDWLKWMRATRDRKALTRLAEVYIQH